MFREQMATGGARPITASATATVSPRPAWRRALNIAVVVLFVVASVAAQAMDLTPVAIALLVIAVVALAPLFAPTVDL